MPVIRALAAAGVPVSVDTYRAAVAEAALDAGARSSTTSSGGLADPDDGRGGRAPPACPWILMHWRGHSRDMQALAHYGDVVADVPAELAGRVDAALAAGVDAEQHRARPRPRLRQDRRAQLGAAAPGSTS